MIEVSSSQAAFLQLVDALNTLGNAVGVDIQVTARVRDGEMAVSPFLENDLEAIRQHMRDDFAWFQAFLNEYPDQGARLRGNYVAIVDERIISVGTDQDLTRLGAAKKLGVESSHVLVVPVQVPESEEYWENVKAELGIE